MRLGKATADTVVPKYCQRPHVKDWKANRNPGKGMAGDPQQVSGGVIG